MLHTGNVKRGLMEVDLLVKRVPVKMLLTDVDSISQTNAKYLFTRLDRPLAWRKSDVTTCDVLW